jgi:hypothetical protein
MVTATFLAIFFIPLFFVMVVQLFGKKKKHGTEQPGSETVSPAEGK